jgi:hypothetical protein
VRTIHTMEAIALGTCERIAASGGACLYYRSGPALAFFIETHDNAALHGTKENRDRKFKVGVMNAFGDLIEFY